MLFDTYPWSTTVWTPSATGIPPRAVLLTDMKKWNLSYKQRRSWDKWEMNYATEVWMEHSINQLWFFKKWENSFYISRSRRYAVAIPSTVRKKEGYHGYNTFDGEDQFHAVTYASLKYYYMGLQKLHPVQFLQSSGLLVPCTHLREPLVLLHGIAKTAPGAIFAIIRDTSLVLKYCITLFWHDRYYFFMCNFERGGVKKRLLN